MSLIFILQQTIIDGSNNFIYSVVVQVQNYFHSDIFCV